MDSLKKTLLFLRSNFHRKAVFFHKATADACKLLKGNNVTAMVYCSNCDHQLTSQTKFCPNCGAPTADAQITPPPPTGVPISTILPLSATGSASQREQLYDGVVHKCPNCGEVLDAFVVQCPLCGYEVRDSKTSGATKEFASKIEAIEAQCRLNPIESEATLSNIENQKVNLIRNFVIPNNKEDILEFMILASSNIRGEQSRSIFEAWIAKSEQCYRKAQLLFENDDERKRIQSIYDQTKRHVVKESSIYSLKNLSEPITRIGPIFTIIVLLVLIYAIIRLVKGEFAGIDIIFDALLISGGFFIQRKIQK